MIQVFLFSPEKKIERGTKAALAWLLYFDSAIPRKASLPRIDADSLTFGSEPESRLVITEPKALPDLILPRPLRKSYFALTAADL